MLVNKSLFPVNTGFSVISDMQRQMEKLQIQLATGLRATTLSELGNERVYDLTIRAQQGRIEGYQSSIQAVDLRLSTMNLVMERLDALEGEVRSSAASGGVGSDNLGIVTAQSLARSRLDEIMTLMQSHVAGRYLFGGGITDASPVGSAGAILDGIGGRDGFRTVANERKLADAGADGRGRVTTDIAELISGLAADTVTLTEDNAGLHPYRPQITNITTTNPAEITVVGPAGVPVEVSVQFGAAVAPGDQVEIEITLPDGSVEQRTFTAVAGPAANSGEFVIGANVNETATNFQVALDAIMIDDTVTLAEDGVHPFGLKFSTLSTNSSAISTNLDTPPPTAGVNTLTFAVGAAYADGADTTTFDVSVDGGAPVSVTITQAMVIAAGNADTTIDNAAELDAVMAAALAAAGVAGVTVANNGADVTLTSNTPSGTSNVTISNFIANAAGPSATTGNGIADSAGTTGFAGGAPQSMSMRFTGIPADGQTVTIGVILPDGTEHTITMTASDNAPPSARQFEIGATPEDTAANFQAALDVELLRLGNAELEAASVYASADNFFAGQGETVQRINGPPFESATGFVAATAADTLTWYTGEDSANARQTVQARVGEGTTVSYGVQANESGILELVKSLAAMAVEDYSASDPDSNARYFAMTQRQLTRLSDSNNMQSGAIEVISLELSLVSTTNNQAKSRHATHMVQLDTMLSDIEQISTEETAMMLLALQVRLEASFQTTATVSRLTLVNYM